MGTGVQAEESQWPHHFNMMGQLFVGFIFLIAAGMSYMVSHHPSRAPDPPLLSSRRTPPRLTGRRSRANQSQYYYLKGRRAERLRSRAASGVMEGGGVAGLAQMRAKMSGRAAQYTSWTEPSRGTAGVPHGRGRVPAAGGARCEGVR